MIITKKYAKQLIRQGNAREEGEMKENEKEYVILTRFDLQRTDHYLL